MRIQFLKYATYCLALLTVTVNVQLFAQEPVDQAPLPVTRPAVKYIDAPVAIEPDVDPILPQPTVVLNPEDDPEFIRRVDTMREYSLSIEQLEAGGGVWDSGLVEELATLGGLQQQQGYIWYRRRLLSDLVANASATARTAAIFCRDRPALRRSASLVASSDSGFGIRPRKRPFKRARIARAAAPASCW